VRGVASLLLGMMLAVTGPAQASHGGPEVVEPLGWDPRTETAYFRIHHLDESGYLPTVVILVRDSLATNPLPVALPRSFYRTIGDLTYEGWIDSLRQSLQPLMEKPSPSLFRGSEVLHADTLDAPCGRFPRYVMRMEDGLIGRFIVENVLCTPRVVIVRSYRTPDRALRFGVLAFQAIPWEQCYEVQIPVAAGFGASVRVRWNRWQ